MAVDYSTVTRSSWPINLMYSCYIDWLNLGLTSHYIAIFSPYTWKMFSISSSYVSENPCGMWITLGLKRVHEHPNHLFSPKGHHHQIHCNFSSHSLISRLFWLLILSSTTCFVYCERALSTLLRCFVCLIISRAMHSLTVFNLPRRWRYDCILNK